MDPTAGETTKDLDLMVIVPRDAPSRAASLNEALAGTSIRIVVDRRQGERRAAYEAATAERGDPLRGRRGHRRPVRRLQRHPQGRRQDRVLPAPPKLVYERVPHITLKSIANNAEIDAIWEKWQRTLEPLREKLNAALKREWREWEIPREAEPKWPEAARKLHVDWWQARIARQKTPPGSSTGRSPGASHSSAPAHAGYFGSV